MNLEDNFIGFEHLGIPVSDIAVSKDFYKKLGFKILSNQEIEENGGITYVSFLGLKGFCLEIYQPYNGLTADLGRGSIDHAALEVENIDAAFNHFSNKGIPVQEEAPVFLPLHKKGVKYFNISGPDNEKIEFIQVLKE